jgi:hypothetical protein
MFGGVGCARFESASERVKPDVHMFVSPIDGGESIGDGDLYVEFFGEFADQGGFLAFVRFDFAAGEFPQSSEMFIGRSQAGQQAAFVFDESANNFNLARWHARAWYASAPIVNGGHEKRPPDIPATL